MEVIYPEPLINQLNCWILTSRSMLTGLVRSFHFSLNRFTLSWWGWLNHCWGFCLYQKPKPRYFKSVELVILVLVVLNLKTKPFLDIASNRMHHSNSGLSASYCNKSSAYLTKRNPRAISSLSNSLSMINEYSYFLLLSPILLVFLSTSDTIKVFH